MAQGVRTPIEQELEFRRQYLRLGNAKAAAREVGIETNISWRLAQRARADADFRAAYAKMRSEAYDQAHMAVMNCMAIAEEEAAQDAYTPERMAQIIQEHGLKTLNWNDARPAFIAQVNKAFDLIAREKEKAEKMTAQDGEGVHVHVHLKGVEAEEDADEDQPPDTDEPA